MVGNVPFNAIRVDDPRYNKFNFRIHDYFIAKSLDKVRPGGIMAVITSKFTMDKANSSMRRYIAEKPSCWARSGCRTTLSSRWPAPKRPRIYCF